MLITMYEHNIYTKTIVY